MNFFRAHRLMGGFTMVEILIALALGSLVLASLMQIYLGTKQSYRMQENLSRIQENARFAMNQIERDIREVGYFDCFDLENLPTTNLKNIKANAIEGTNDDGLNNSDSITLRWSKTVCAANVSDTLVNAYFYNLGLNPNQRVSLYRRTDVVNGAVGNALEVVEDVENFQVLYGIDTDDDFAPNYYAPIGTVGLDMSRIVSIRIALVFISAEDYLASSPLPYQIFNQRFTPNDQRIRRVFTTTIDLRNPIGIREALP